MCTALHFVSKDHYFGRNLDLDCSYAEQVCITPRNFPLPFRRMAALNRHYAMIGMATVVDGLPLYYDCANEKGLCMAGLNFPGNAVYYPEKPDADNVTPFEFIPWILGQCATVKEAGKLLERLNLVDIPFSDRLPLSPLHWILCDADSCIVVETLADGMHIHENPIGVMTNNPPFPYHLENLNNYRALSSATPANTFGGGLPLDVYCQGLGGIGLPGDVSSMSRFVRMAFHAANSVRPGSEEACVSQFFHLLTSVEMPKGSCLTDSGHWDITVYSSCINAACGRYYYTTYCNRQISCVDMHRENLDGDTLAAYSLITREQIALQN